MTLIIETVYTGHRVRVCVRSLPKSRNVVHETLAHESITRECRKDARELVAILYDVNPRNVRFRER